MTPPADTTPTLIAAKRRQRWPKGLARPTVAPFPWADKEPRWNRATTGDWFRAIYATQAYQDIVAPVLAERTAAQDPRSRYTAEEREAVLMLRSLTDRDSMRQAWMHMTSDACFDLRRVIGLDRPREFRTSFERVTTDGIPSVATLSRHRKDFPLERATEVWRECFDAIVREHLDTYEKMREEARTLFVDGTTVGTRYTVPIRDRQTGELKNADQVTFPDGGFQARNDGKDGPGLMHVNLLTCRGLPLAFRNLKRHHSETGGLKLILEHEFRDQLRSRIPGLVTLSGDRLYQSPWLRKLSRELGIVENLAFATRGADDLDYGRTGYPDAADPADARAGADEAEASVSGDERAGRQPHHVALARIRRRIDGHPTWFATGHREIVCRCAHGGQISRGFETRTDATATPHGFVPRTWVRGECDRCGSITIVSGEWALVDTTGGKQYRRARPGDAIDWALGNGLTYYDLTATALGSARYVRQEGYHGAIAAKFKFNVEDRWLRNRAQADYDASVFGVLLHALAMQQRDAGGGRRVGTWRRAAA